MPVTSTSMEMKNRSRLDKVGWTKLLAVFMLLAIPAGATENGASVFPVGVETVMTGMYPHPGKTMFYEYTAFYEANRTVNGQGQSAAPEFKLRVFATAIKISNTWNYKFLGGNLNSNIAIPAIYQQLHVMPGKFEKYAIGNVDLVPLALVYHREVAHWYCEADAFMPGTAYSQSDVLNIGQHNLALGPVCGVTVLPNHGRTEISARNSYLFNGPDKDAHFHSGNEYFTEFNVARAVSKKAALALNGFIYQQTTDDKQNLVPYLNGDRGRDLGIGPQLRINLPHGGMAFKYLRDTLVENKPKGNAFWFQIAVPFPIRGTSH
jgi:hypothetical protein